MEKISKTIKHNLGSVKIYFDDILEIVSILKENEIETTLSTKKYKYTIDEIENIKKEDGPLDYLYICASPVTLIINSCFLSTYTSLTCSNDSSRSVGIVTQIKDILFSKKRNLINIFSSMRFVISFASIFLFLFIFLDRYLLLTTDVPKLMLLYILLCIFLFLGIGFFHRSIIYLNKKKELPSFFCKNKDQLIVGIIVTLISILGTLLIKYLL